MTDIKIGSECWMIDRDNWKWRQTRRAEDQIKSYYIVGENKRSWLIGFKDGIGRADRDAQYKVDKKTLKTLGGNRDGWGPPRFLFSAKDKDDWIWLINNHHRLAEYIGGIQNADLLRAVAKVVGYKDREVEDEVRQTQT